ncbi:MAG TPA: MOP flippase family protein [Verrucomicrobiae bacterium]|nr:MOP flippase family protein [Verrucomicrobiae bacterium]
MSLKAQTFTAIRWTTLATVGRSVLRIAQMAILARLLAQADFGLMAIVLSVLAFMQVFTDLGVSTAIIHYQDISQDQLSSLYWLTVTVGLALMVLLIATSSLLSGFVFHQPALQPILMLVSVDFLFHAAGQQVRVMAEKALRFSALSKVELLAALSGCVTAIVWAWYSRTVYALVAGALVNEFVQTLLLWLLASQGWRPNFRLRLREIAQFLKFGGYIMAGDFINSLNRQADILIGGRIFPAATLGSYSLPRNLSLNVSVVINSIVTRVGLPVMAKVQHDRILLKSVYLKTMRMTASINFPIYLALAVFSRETVVIVFGKRWIGSAPLLVFLAVFGMFRSCGNPAGSLLYAVGKADLALRWNLALFFVMFPALWLASHFGITGLAEGQAVLMAGLVIPMWYFLIRPNCGAHLGEYLLTLLSPLTAALVAVLAGYLAVSYLTTPLWRLAGAVLVATPIYLVASWVVNRSWVIAMRQLIFRQ